MFKDSSLVVSEGSSNLLKKKAVYTRRPKNHTVNPKRSISRPILYQETSFTPCLAVGGAAHAILPELHGIQTYTTSTSTDWNPNKAAFGLTQPCQRRPGEEVAQGMVTC